jgi:hypothetical protein
MSDLHPRLRAGERTMLEQFLEQHRHLVLEKCGGLSDADAAAHLLPHTAMTIGGIVKHLARMEDLWFTHKLAGDAYPEPWASAPLAADDDWDFHSAATDQIKSLLDLYATSCARSRAVAARYPDLDSLAALPSFGKGPVSLRWVYLHMIRETAQHCGHLDLMLDVVSRRG